MELDEDSLPPSGACRLCCAASMQTPKAGKLVMDTILSTRLGRPCEIEDSSPDSRAFGFGS